jgi:hypothetical protein
MSTSYIACRKAFGTALLVTLLGTVPHTVGTASSATSPQQSQVKSSPAACAVIERPKHTIRKCRCDAGTLSSIRSIDTAEIVRLLLGGQPCVTSSGSQK